MTAQITLYDHNGDQQSSGIVRDDKIGEWIWGGDHIAHRPLGLVRRIFRDWVEDGGDRNYSGRDETTGATFRVQPYQAREVAI